MVKIAGRRTMGSPDSQQRGQGNTMAVEAIGSADASTNTARTEFQRVQLKLAEDLAAKAAEKVAAKDKAVLTRTEEESLQERQTTSKTLDIGQLGSSLDLII
jgi:hypothetical protein